MRAGRAGAQAAQLRRSSPDSYGQASDRRGGDHRARAARAAGQGSRLQTPCRCADAPPIAPARAPQPQPTRRSRHARACAWRGGARGGEQAKRSCAAVRRYRAGRKCCAEALPGARARGAQQIFFHCACRSTRTSPQVDVKQAFVRSGVLFEPRVAAGKVRRDFAATRLRQTRRHPRATSRPRCWCCVRCSRAGPTTTGAARLPRRRSCRPHPISVDAPRPAAPLADAAAIRHLANALAGTADELLPAAAPLSPEQATSLAKASRRNWSRATRRIISLLLRPRLCRAVRRRLTVARRSARSRRWRPASRPTPRRTRAPNACSPRPTARSRARPCCRPPRCRTSQTAAHRSAAQRWTFEVPFATPQGTSIAQFEVSRDAAGARNPTASLRPGGRASRSTSSRWGRCMRWSRSQARAPASRSGPSAHATAARLNDNAAMLNDALRAAELEPADVLFRVGAPPNVARQAAPGRFMDRAS